METPIKDKQTAETGYDFGEGLGVAGLAVIGLTFLNPKVAFPYLFVGAVIGYAMSKSGQDKTMPLRLAAAIISVLACFMGQATSEFRLGVKNSGQGLLQYYSPEHVIQAFGAASHDAPFWWYLGAAALGFIYAARTQPKNKIASPDEPNRAEGEKKNT
jgi:hypothetical protein